jgi:hypothetical protein
MLCRLAQNQFFRASLGICIALALCGVRTEKAWADALSQLDANGVRLSAPMNDHEPFDTARVPQSGGMASRLLAGLKIDLTGGMGQRTTAPLKPKTKERRK